MTFLALIYIFGWLMAFAGNPGGFAIVFLGTPWLLYILYINERTNNYDHGRVDANKMAEDRRKNNLNDYQVRQNMINGKYDKK